jgi:hypothetical protein
MEKNIYKPIWNVLENNINHQMMDDRKNLYNFKVCLKKLVGKKNILYYDDKLLLVIA